MFAFSFLFKYFVLNTIQDLFIGVAKRFEFFIHFLCEIINYLILSEFFSAHPTWCFFTLSFFYNVLFIIVRFLDIVFRKLRAFDMMIVVNLFRIIDALRRRNMIMCFASLLNTLNQILLFSHQFLLNHIFCRFAYTVIACFINIHLVFLVFIVNNIILIPSIVRHSIILLVFIADVDWIKVWVNV